MAHAYSQTLLAVVIDNLLPVKGASFISKSILSSAKLTEILCRLGSDIGTKFEGDSTHVLTAYFHVKVDCIGRMTRESRWQRRKRVSLANGLSA